jgi:hypothetical protein
VNFTNIQNAVKAIEAIKNKPEYSTLRIAHGKDRCANPPRSGPQGGSGGRRQVSGSNGHQSNGDAAIEGDDDIVDDLKEEHLEVDMHVDGEHPHPNGIAAA